MQLNSTILKHPISAETINAPFSNGAQLQHSLILRITAGFGTLLSQVAGLHRAVPSATLDKVFIFLPTTLYQFSLSCQYFVPLPVPCRLECR